MPELDELKIKLQADATKANDAIDKLVLKLDRLSTSLGKINGNSLVGLANGVNKLSNSMQAMNGIKTADFTRLAKNLEKLSNINSQGMIYSASAISTLTGAFNSLTKVSANAQQVGVLASNLSKLGYKSIATATANIPLLANALNQLMVTLSQAPQVSKNVIDMTNALANLAAQGSKVGSSTNYLVGGLNNTHNATKKTRKSVMGLAAAFGKFYASYFLVIRGLKKLWESIESTADYIEAYNYFDVALEKVSKSWNYQWTQNAEENAEKYSKTFTEVMTERLEKMSGLKVDISEDGTGLLTTTGLKNLGLNIQEVTQYAAQLASVTNSIGQTAEVSLAAASAFTKLGADMSSLFNIDYSEAMKNLQSGLIGQSRALYKYGIDITNATLQTKAYELGIDKAVSEMTQSEKQQLRMLVILEQSKVAWGDLAHTINSPSNMIRQFKNNLKEAGIVLGQLFIPILQSVMPLLNGFTIAVKEFLVNLATVMGIELDFSQFGQGYTEIEDGLEDIDDVLDGVTASAKKAKAALRGFDELKVINTADSTANADAASGTVDLTDAILKATSEYEKAWAEAYDGMQSKAQEVAQRIYGIFKPLEKLFSDIRIGDWFEVGNDVSSLTSGIFDFLSNAIRRVDWDRVGNKIGLFLKGVNWTDILSSLGNLIWVAINASITAWNSAFDTAPIETTIATALSALYITGNPQIALILTLSGVALNLATDIGNWLGKKTVEKLFEHMGLDTSQVWEMEDIDVKSALKIFFSSEFQTKNKFLHSLIMGTAANYLKLQLDNVSKVLGNFVSEMQKRFSNVGEYFSMLFSKEAWTNYGNGIVIGIQESWLKFTENWKRTGISKWYNNEVKPFFASEKWSWNGIREGLSSAFENAIESVKSLWNKFAEWLNEKLSFEIEPITMFGKQITSGTTITLGKVPTFATGGFPEDGLFMANHNELVGKFSNGRTAVANNSQIIAGIEAAAYNGMSRALSEHKMGATFKIEGDPKGMFKVMRQEDREYYNRTGRPAFNF